MRIAGDGISLFELLRLVGQSAADVEQPVGEVCRARLPVGGIAQDELCPYFYRLDT